MTTQDTYRLLRAFVDELARCGMRDCCTSPGSRNTPIVLSLTRDARLRCWSHIDERCAGFFAVGAAKASGRPVAVTCTSGTAAAELAPAVTEAHWAGVPLIVLTADRPAELRDVGAGQAIDQLKLYGSAVKWFVEVDPADAGAASLRWIRQLADRAWTTAVSGRPGPVHLNFPLREPLVLEAPLPADGERDARPDGRPWVTSATAPPAAPEPPLALPARTVLIAGGTGPGAQDGAALADAARRLEIPLLADPLSGARRGAAAIAHYDLLLRDPALREAVRPELVLRVGDLPTSKPLRAWLAGLSDVRQVALGADPGWQDPDAVLALRLAADPVAVLDQAHRGGPAGTGEAAGMDEAAGTGEADYLTRWRSADAAVSEAIAATLGDELSEPAVARILGDAVSDPAILFVASSMPIRDVEEFTAVRPDPPRVLSNRGANGIDGTVSAAFGAAAASGPDHPVVLLIGDVTLVHDLGGLLAARRLGLELTIVLVNNDGGGIFHFLAVSGEADAFEDHVATPHGLAFDAVAALFGLRHVRPRTPSELRAAVAEAVGSGAVTLIEVRTERAANLALHRRVADAALAAIDSQANNAATNA